MTPTVARPATPQLSVVIVTPVDFDLIRETVAAVQAQSVRDQIELILVAADPEQLQPDPALVAGLWGVQVLPGGPPWREARAAGVRQARAGVVVFAEEHSFPEPGWAQALLTAYRGQWAAVSPAVINANPETTVSWAGAYVDFGQALAPVAAETDVQPAGHNTSYKRSVLLEYEPALGFWLANEFLLFRDLLARGYHLYLEPAAQVRHVNISRFRSLLWAKFYSGRLFGAGRAVYSRWPFWRRLVYVLGLPLFGLARLRFVLRAVRRTGRQREMLPRIVPAAAACLFVHGLGEALGIAFGPGQAAENWVTFEFSRRQHLAPGEASRLWRPEARPA